MHIACPHCYAINNVPESKDHTQANCGKCQQKLHTHQPCQLTQHQFYRETTCQFWSTFGPVGAVRVKALHLYLPN